MMDMAQVLPLLFLLVLWSLVVGIALHEIATK